MGALGYFLKLSQEQEKKFLLNIQKFAENLDPDLVRSQIEGYATKVDSLHETSQINNDLLNTIVIYLMEKDKEGWDKAQVKVKEMKKKIEEDRRKKLEENKHRWKTAHV